MTAEPVPIVPLDDGNFTADTTTTISLGPCLCAGRPHDEDTAEILDEIPWGVLTDVGAIPTPSGRIAALALVGLVAWNLTDQDGNPVPITADTVGRLRPLRMATITEALDASYERTNRPLPNGSGAPSRRSRPGSASLTPTIRPHGKHTK